MILHIDMDAFFTSVEQLDNPELRGKCLIVGGLSNRGVVAAASYEARKYGIRSAMPTFQAKQKCPDIVIIPPNRRRYSEISKKIMAILNNFSPIVEQVSIDEAYVDITGCEKVHGDPEQTAVKIKTRIKEIVDLTCSIGIAPNKFLAKIASDIEKPNGLTIITPDKTTAFIASLPIRKVPGVGKVAHRQLDQIGIKTLGDVRKHSKTMLMDRLGKFGNRLIELSHGIDDSSVIPYTPAKSVSSEETLSADTTDKDILGTLILKQSETVGRQLRKSEAKAKKVILKVKHSDFKQFTRSITLSQATQSSEVIYKKAKELLDAYTIKKRIRLIGVGASGLVPCGTPAQMRLFDSHGKQNDNWEKIDKAVDDISRKFGKGIIQRAKLHNS